MYTVCNRTQQGSLAVVKQATHCSLVRTVSSDGRVPFKAFV